MRIKIEQFLRNYGIRTSGELLRPRLHSQLKLVLPHESTYHFLDSNTTVLGPTQNDPLINRFTGKVFIEHVTKLEIIEGMPIRTSVIANSLVMDFRRNNRFFKLLRKDQAVRLNTQNVPVFNYNFLNRLYRYQTNMLSNYNRWRNINHTFWKGVVDVGERYDWNQFINLELPRTMPTYAEFRRIEAGLTKNVLEAFNDDAKLNLMEVIKFFGPNQSQSTLYQLLKPVTTFNQESKTEVTTGTRELIDKVNIIVRVRNSFFVMNLGKLYDYRDNADDVVNISNESFVIPANTENYDETEESVSTERFVDSLGLEAHFKPNVLQLRLVSLFTTLVEYANGGEGGVLPEESAPDSDAEKLEDIETGEADTEPSTMDLDSEDDPLEDSPELDETPEEVEIDHETKPTTTLDKKINLDEVEISYTPPPNSELEPTVLVIEKDPLEKEHGTLNVDERNASGIEVEPETGDPLIDEIAKIAKEMVEVGAISPRTYENTIEQSRRYLSLEDPYGTNKPLGEAMIIKPKNLEIPQGKLLKASGVSDDSMAFEVHRKMKQQYIKKVLPKDIMNAIVSVQKQGVIVMDIKSEVHTDALNSYREFSVSLKPIRGKQSTVRFRIPEIDDNGRFIANGVEYSQRTQVGDIPIRKVNPTTVALTSYYSKVFVRRSDLAVNSYDRWLHRNIVRLSMERDIETNDFTVKNLRVDPKDLSAYKLPRTYTRLALELDGFDVGDYRFNFNYANRELLVKDSELKKIERNGMVLAGLYKSQYITIGSDESWYLTKDGNSFDPLESLEEILGLDLTKAPVEIATMGVLNKAIPLGFILAYRNGLTKLLESLKIDYVSHPRGTRFKLASDEFTLVFMDEVLVFNRSDYRANLIIGGLRTYRKTLNMLSRWDMDRADAYYRLADGAGITSNYLREIDNLYRSWMDPITQGLLQDMGEPTNYEGLLYRALELLMIDWSPNEVDGAYLRYKGYERMAGIVYSTLARTVNRFNAQQGRGKQTIELNPYEVWQKITTDPTVSVIEDSNPIQNLREQEVVTFSGEGGRSGQTLVARTRVYHKNDMGIVSESTVDSGNAGAVFYLTPDANFTSVRGVTKPFDSKNDGAAKIFSTAALVSVGTENDDYLNIVPFNKELSLIAGNPLESNP